MVSCQKRSIGMRKGENLFPESFGIFRHIVITLHGSGIDLKVEDGIPQAIKAAIRVCSGTFLQHPVDVFHSESDLLMSTDGYGLTVFRINHCSPEAFGQELLIAFQLPFVTTRQFAVVLFHLAQPFDLAMQCIQ